MSIYLLSPALFFSLLVRVQVEATEALRTGAFMILFVAAVGAVALLSGRALGLETSATAALLLCTMFMNAGNYGLPVARFAFGEEGFERAAFFAVQAVLEQTLAVHILGAGHGDLRGGFRRLLRMPQLYAILAALAVRLGGAAPTLLDDGVLGNLFSGVSLVSDAAVPILLVVLGLQLAKAEGIREGRWVALATGLRLLVSVPIALVLAGLLGLDDLSADLAVLLASMPTAVNMSILSIEFNVRPRFVGSVVTVVPTAASVLTLTLLLILVQAT